MNSPCPDVVPAYYPMTLHTIAIFSIPINFAGFYLLLFKSPKMQGYKYCLCYLQLASFLTEMQMSLLCAGYYFFPIIGGINTGWEIISSHASMTLYMFIFPFELPSALLCFIYRHNAAQKIGTNIKNKRIFKKVVLILCHIFPFVTSFCMWKSELTKEQQYAYMATNWPKCLKWLENSAFVVYDYGINKWLAVLGIGALSFVAIIFSYALVLAFQTMSILHKLRRQMSRQTFQMHKMALISLCMQFIIPGVLIVTPLGFCAGIVVTGAVELQEIATDTMFLIGSHSSFQCIVMISSNSNYRNILKKTFFSFSTSSDRRIHDNSIDPSSFNRRTRSIV